MAQSFVAAVIDLYQSIPEIAFGGAGTRPPLYLGQAPQVKSTDQQRPPYVVLYDNGFRPEFDNSKGGIERGEIRLEVYALKLDDPTEISVDRIVRAMKYGGQAPGLAAGLDFGAFVLTGFSYKIELRRTREQRSYAGFNHQGARVHKCELTYAVILGLAAS